MNDLAIGVFGLLFFLALLVATLAAANAVLLTAALSMRGHFRVRPGRIFKAYWLRMLAPWAGSTGILVALVLLAMASKFAAGGWLLFALALGALSLGALWRGRILWDGIFPELMGDLYDQERDFKPRSA